MISFAFSSSVHVVVMLNGWSCRLHCRLRAGSGVVVLVLLDELLLEDFVDLLRRHADGLVTRLHQALHLRSQDDQLGLVKLD